MKKLIDLLHMLICTEPHETDMLSITSRKDGYCYYYLECDISGGEEMESHITWAENFDGFKHVMDLKSDVEAEKFLRETIQISQSVRSISASSKERLVFIKRLLP